MMTDSKRRAVARRIEELERDGRTTPDDIVADARLPESPLHDLFDWNLETAAQEHWRSTARQILRTVKYHYVTEDQEVTVSRYVRDPEREHKQQGYVAVPHLVSDSEQSARALEREFRSALAALNRAARYAAFLGVSTETDRLIRSTEHVLRSVKRTKQEAAA